MDPNPYTPPSAFVADIREADPDEQLAFFAVSQSKLAVMTVCTFNLYGFYWFYKNWKVVRRHTRDRISPVWRTVFALFFYYSLFRRVRDAGAGMRAANLPAGLLAIGMIFLPFLGLAPGLWGILGAFSFLPSLPVQAAMNEINRKVAPGHDPNDRYSAWNWVAIAIGAPLTVLSVLAPLLPNK